MKNYKKKLQAIIDEDKESIRAYVAEDILDSLDGYNGDAAGYLKDVSYGGCQSGMVSGLVYYTDTKAFYIKYIDEIDELREEMEQSIGEPLKIGFPSYNWLAWFGYEETARKIADELGIEI